jgi:hypothetical protein
VTEKADVANVIAATFYPAAARARVAMSGSRSQPRDVRLSVIVDLKNGLTCPNKPSHFSIFVRVNTVFTLIYHLTVCRGFVTTVNSEICVAEKVLVAQLLSMCGKRFVCWVASLPIWGWQGARSSTAQGAQHAAFDIEMRSGTAPDC